MLQNCCVYVCMYLICPMQITDKATTKQRTQWQVDVCTYSPEFTSVRADSRSAVVVGLLSRNRISQSDLEMHDFVRVVLRRTVLVDCCSHSQSRTHCCTVIFCDFTKLFVCITGLQCAHC